MIILQQNSCLGRDSDRKVLKCALTTDRVSDLWRNMTELAYRLSWTWDGFL